MHLASRECRACPVGQQRRVGRFERHRQRRGGERPVRPGRRQPRLRRLVRQRRTPLFGQQHFARQRVQRHGAGFRIAERHLGQRRTLRRSVAAIALRPVCRVVRGTGRIARHQRQAGVHGSRNRDGRRMSRRSLQPRQAVHPSRSLRRPSRPPGYPGRSGDQDGGQQQAEEGQDALHDDDPILPRRTGQGSSAGGALSAVVKPGRP